MDPRLVEYLCANPSCPYSKPGHGYRTKFNRCQRCSGDLKSSITETPKTGTSGGSSGGPGGPVHTSQDVPCDLQTPLFTCTD